MYKMSLLMQFEKLKIDLMLPGLSFKRYLSVI